MRAGYRLVWLVIVCMVVPATAFAQDTASLHFPNDGLSCPGAPNTCNVESTVVGGVMDITVVATGLPNVKTNPANSIILASGDAGNVVAAKAVNEVCDACVALAGQGVTMSGFIVGTGVCNAGGCCATTSAQTVTLTCEKGGEGFDLTRVATGDSFSVGPFPGATGNIQNLTCRTNGGNSIAVDLLDTVLVQVGPPTGLNQTATIDVYRVGQQNPNSASVNLSTFGGSYPRHAEIARLMKDTLGIGLNAIHHLSHVASSYSGDPQLYKGEDFVETRNAKSSNVREVEVDGVPGQTLVIGTDDLPGPRVPALSAWGTVILVALMLLSTLWLLRRAGRRSEA